MHKRWRAKATQVQPPLSEKELISTFIQEGQRIKDGIKTGKVLDYSKFYFPIKQNPPKRHELKLIPNGKESVSTIEFCEK